MEDAIRVLAEKAAATLKAAGAREVYVFGSAAKGSMRTGSDLDLAVSGLPPALFFKTMAQVGDLIKQPFDLVDLDEPTPFTRYLKSGGGLVRVG